MGGLTMIIITAIVVYHLVYIRSNVNIHTMLRFIVVYPYPPGANMDK